MPFDLTDKVALVTGAGQGMGKGIAELLAAQGAAVVINDYYDERAQQTAQQLQQAGHRALPVQADLLDSGAVEQMIKKVTEEFGQVDILVNNAGIPADGMVPRRFLETDEAEWRRYLELNLVAVMRCCRSLVPDMCERGWGRVINIVSEAWRNTAGAMGIAAYGAGKAGTVGFSRHLSGEVAANGVTVNCVSLGLMNNTGMEQAVRQIPRGRLGTPQDVAAAVLYFASHEADWVTGQILAINGGAVVG